MTGLAQRHCEPCADGMQPLTRGQVLALLAQVSGWMLNEAGNEISRTFSFSNYYETMAFVNAVAWIAHREDHHPDIDVGYNKCRVRYATHAIGGLSHNDLICAARINLLLDA